MEIVKMKYPEIKAAARRGAIALLPTASLEQHGSHLPVTTDTDIVTAVAKAALEKLPAEVEVLLFPTLWLGASYHHAYLFAASVDEKTYIELITDLGLSLGRAGFRKLFILNGHGGNSPSLRIAVAHIHRQNPELLTATAEYWSLAAAAVNKLRTTGPGGAAHAGELETSLMLHLKPETVEMEKAVASLPSWPPGFVRDLTAGGPVTVSVDWQHLSIDGPLGNPKAATSQKGEAIFDLIVEAVSRTLTDFYRLDPAKPIGGVSS